ncbi:DUF5908 family protein [Polyangium sp. y55x31]|uniref:DUF5908 family protein n=1 Tax=Polyangium sp. y55x31 TaxID=3042688 RepID=UPI002482F0E0|nr:DUF5908 family protein [Polyangium sp. y55x31]MDI1478924.1 DUF5908 family protein [Polyangium sp. y55x31]
MPIFVEEVVITVEVGEEPAKDGATRAPSPEDRGALVRECVERVLEILEQREER